MKYRMYFFVPYNLSPIQQGIQAGHAALEYASKFGNNDDYKSFVTNDKTWIILNGGTTNNNMFGTMQDILMELHSIGVNLSIFQEPDINDALTAICFLTSEVVWDYETYPDFYDWLTQSYPEYFDTALKYKKHQDLLDNEYYKEWMGLMGEKNVLLRNLLKNKKLA